MSFFACFVNVESLLDICCELVDFCEFCSKENGFSAGKYFDAPAQMFLQGSFICVIILSYYIIRKGARISLSGKERVSPMKKSPKSAKSFASRWSAFLQQFKNLHLRGDRFVMLTVAGLINAFGVSVFLYPVNLYDSGISGTAMLLAQITPDWCSLSLILLLLNVPLFLFGLKRQGVQFTIYAVYSVFIYSLGAWLIQGPLPLDVSISSPLAGTDLLLCALFGGLISGVGSGLAIRGGGAMDGMEVMAVIFARKLGMTVGTFVMSYNVVLYILAGLLRSSWILPLYSIIAYAVGLKVVDFVIEGIDRSKAALIVTRNPDAICRALGEAFGTGMTCIPAQGGFSHEEMTIVYFVVNRFQISRMKDIVHDLDDRAYITISEVADVFKLNQDKLSQKVDNQPLLPRRK